MQKKYEEKLCLMTEVNTRRARETGTAADAGDEPADAAAGEASGATAGAVPAATQDGASGGQAVQKGRPRKYRKVSAFELEQGFLLWEN